MSHHLIWLDNILKVNFSKVVNYDDIIACINEISSNPNFDNVLYQLVDFTNTIEVKFSNDSLLEFAELDTASSFSNSKITIIFISNKKEIKDKIKIYLYHMQNTSWNTVMFDTLDEAMKYINNDLKKYYNK